MDIVLRTLKIADLPKRATRRWRGIKDDYRDYLFEDLQRRLNGRRPARILEIGPRDGIDSKRLCSLKPDKLVLVDLPNQKERIEGWLPTLGDAPVELKIGNFMYDTAFDTLEPFDVVWCTGVLYHNPEQLRFVRQLYDITAPGGVLAMETATARRRVLRDENCVEIWYPPNKAKSGPYHVSVNVTHMPSAKAVESWLSMVGFTDVERSSCMRRQSLALDATRAGFIASRAADAKAGVYYGIFGHDFPIGRAR